MADRLRAGMPLGACVTSQLGPFISPGLLIRVPTLIRSDKGGNVTSAIVRVPEAVRLVTFTSAR